MDRAIDLLKPGVSSDRIARSFPTAKDIGFSSEMEAFGLNFCHGLGTRAARASAGFDG